MAPPVPAEATTCPDPASSADLSDLLSRIAQEISEAAHTCTAVQWVIATLLERAHHPDLPAELHMLQDIDRLQQTLADLGGLLDFLGPRAHATQVPAADIAHALKLESLRARLCGKAVSDETPDVSPDADITWL